MTSASLYLLFEDNINNTIDPLFTPNDPVAVANDYWIVTLTKGESFAKKYTLEANNRGDWVVGHHQDDRAFIGEVEQQDGVYYINTQLLLNRDERSVINLYTVVTSVNGQYKVDEYATYSSFYDASLKSALNAYESSVTNAASYLDGEMLVGINSDMFEKVARNNIEARLCDASNQMIRSIAGDDTNPICTSGSK